MSSEIPANERYLNGKLKRSVDILGGVAFLPLAIAAVGILGLAIKMEDGGDVFFHQDRVGQNGKIFSIHKLRTYNDQGEITKIGAKIRPYGIDELPQVINVFKGEMSIFGPRAIPVADFNWYANLHTEYPDDFDQELVEAWKESYTATRPGGISLSLVSGESIVNRHRIGAESIRKKMQDDIEQVKGASLQMDLHVLKTLFRSVIGK